MIAHIEPWAKVQVHEFHNLILLCHQCHARYDNSKDIDRKAMRQYKTNLSVLNGRYSELERRVLEGFAQDNTRVAFNAGPDSPADYMYLLRDGLLVEVPWSVDGMQGFQGGQPIRRRYELTARGRDFLERWLDAQPIEDVGS